MPVVNKYCVIETERCSYTEPFIDFVFNQYRITTIELRRMSDTDYLFYWGKWGL